MVEVVDVVDLREGVDDIVVGGLGTVGLLYKRWLEVWMEILRIRFVVLCSDDSGCLLLLSKYSYIHRRLDYLVMPAWCRRLGMTLACKSYCVGISRRLVSPIKNSSTLHHHVSPSLDHFHGAIGIRNFA
jgi:hypothetical protein